MHPCDLNVLLKGDALEKPAIDISTILVSNRDELDELMTVLAPYNIREAIHVAQVHTLHFEGRADDTIVIQQSELVFLSYKVPYLRTLMFTHVAYLRPTEGLRPTEVFSNFIGLARIVIDDIWACSDDRLDEFYPQDLAYFLSPFKRVTEVQLCTDGLADVLPNQEKLQGLLDGLLYSSCTVDKLTLCGDDWETKRAWVSALHAQHKFLKLRVVLPREFGRVPVGLDGI